jgi:hypothetical protein
MAVNTHKIPNMSYNEQQAEIDQYTQMDFGGSWMTNYAGVLETHLPSDYSNCLMGMNQQEILTQLPQEVHPQYAQSVYESFSGLQYSLHPYETQSCQQCIPETIHIGTCASSSATSQFGHRVGLDPLLAGCHTSKPVTVQQQLATPCEVGSGFPNSLLASNLVNSTELEQSFAPSSDLSDTYSNNAAAVPPPLKDAMNPCGNRADVIWAAPLLENTKGIETQVEPLSEVSGGSLRLKDKRKNPNSNRFVKHYLVKRIDEEVFDLEGKLVSFAVISTNRDVTALTGLGSSALQKAKLYLGINWGDWRVTYLGRATLNDEVKQSLLEGLDIEQVRSSWFCSDPGQAQQENNQEITYAQVTDGLSFGNINQDEVWEVSYADVSTDSSTWMPRLGSSHPIHHETGSQMPHVDEAGNWQPVMIPGKRCYSMISRMNIQKGALNRPTITDTTRAKMSLSAAHAKSFHVERKSRIRFLYGGQSVDFTIIRTVYATAEFLNCSIPTLHRALHRRDMKKGIVKQIWKVWEVDM